MIYVIYLIVIFVLLVFLYLQWQKSVMYHPRYVREDELYDQNYKFISIKTDDGVMLEGCVYQPQKFKKTFLYFGGRGQDSVGLLPKLAKEFSEYRIITFNYRGYGKSGAKPSKEKILADAKKIVAVLKKHYGSFELFGYSLGSSVASYVAQEIVGEKVVLVGGFSSIKELIYTQYKFIPPFWRDDYKTCLYLSDVKKKIALFASEDDTVVPFQVAKQLAKCNKNITLYQYSKLNHVELLWDREVNSAIKKFFNT